MAQTAAPRTPRTIKTPVPRMRSSAVRLPTPRTALREDLDRFIPSRRRMNMDLCRRKLNSASKPRGSSSVAGSGPASDVRVAELAYKKELLSTLCNVPTSALDDDLQLKSMFQYGNVSPLKGVNRRPVVAADPFAMDFLRSSSTTGFSQKITVAKRVFDSRPESVLDAPEIMNDFYTHPLSWSKDNVLAIALGPVVFLLNESTDAVHELVDLSKGSRDGNSNSNLVKVVKWCTIEGLTHFLAVGTDKGVRMYDTICRKEVHTSLGAGGGPVRALCWNDTLQWLTVGYATGKLASLDWRSRCITGMTRRVSASSSSPLSVCNVAWDAAGTCLASGRNDNTIHLWDAAMMRIAQTAGGPRLVLESHAAAVKGLAWCPYRRDLLASGGGTADRCVKLWDACSGCVMSSVCTGNQVSSLVWGQHHQELYSGHGFTDNEVAVWSYPKMERLETLSYHKDRILCMDLNPDGSKLTSIGVDECLCIWKIDAVPTRRDGAMFDSPSFGARFTIR